MGALIGNFFPFVLLLATFRAVSVKGQMTGKDTIFAYPYHGDEASKQIHAYLSYTYLQGNLFSSYTRILQPVTYIYKN